MVNVSDRLERLREKLVQKKLSAILISNSANKFYLTNWLSDEESGYLLITLKRALIITDSRYTEEAVVNVPNFELREYGISEDFWLKIFQEAKVDIVGFEAMDLTFERLKALRKKSKVKFRPTIGLVEALRAVKSDEEVRFIKKAASIADKSFDYILRNIRMGMTEKQIAWELEKFMRNEGASKNAWDHFIVSSGRNSSMVHYAAGKRKVKVGDMVLLDWGCYFEGYCCDISRTIFLGTPSDRQAEVYSWVLEAQGIALEQVKVGIKTKDADSAAREFLKEKTNYYFKHSIGHGVGIEVHELPAINEKSNEKFEKGNIITIEPGVYIPGWGGVRIEDMFSVSESSSNLLTKSPKEISEVTLR